MKQEDWKRILQTWKSSRKHHQLKQKIKIKNMFDITKPELEEMISGIMLFNELSDEDKEAFDWLDLEIKTQTTKEDIINSLIQTMIKWYFHQFKYQEMEEYELCCKIRDVIDVEIAEAKRIINTYFFQEDMDDEIIDALKESSREQVFTNYYIWIETLKTNY